MAGCGRPMNSAKHSNGLIDTMAGFAMYRRQGARRRFWECMWIELGGFDRAWSALVKCVVCACGGFAEVSIRCQTGVRRNFAFKACYAYGCSGACGIGRYRVDEDGKTREPFQRTRVVCSSNPRFAIGVGSVASTNLLKAEK